MGLGIVTNQIGLAASRRTLSCVESRSCSSEAVTLAGVSVSGIGPGFCSPVCHCPGGKSKGSEGDPVGPRAPSLVVCQEWCLQFTPLWRWLHCWPVLVRTGQRCDLPVEQSPLHPAPMWYLLQSSVPRRSLLAHVDGHFCRDFVGGSV